MNFIVWYVHYTLDTYISCRENTEKQKLFCYRRNEFAGTSISVDTILI